MVGHAAIIVHTGVRRQHWCGRLRITPGRSSVSSTVRASTDRLAARDRSVEQRQQATLDSTSSPFRIFLDAAILVDHLLSTLTEAETVKERIAVNPAIHFGKPCVAGTRIPVQSVLELVREGLSFAEIIRDYYPDLEPEDIRACIQYAIDVVAAEDIRLATTP
ncbi:MAG TPA: DUF433 domain-containing protein [Thermoguttaceae bacterium]|nr:DUF433 domain-containing protein [Thermoguttaceae bacterium]